MATKRTVELLDTYHLLPYFLHLQRADGKLNDPPCSDCRQRSIILQQQMWFRYRNLTNGTWKFMLKWHVTHFPTTGKIGVRNRRTVAEKEVFECLDGMLGRVDDFGERFGVDGLGSRSRRLLGEREAVVVKNQERNQKKRDRKHLGEKGTAHLGRCWWNRTSRGIDLRNPQKAAPTARRWGVRAAPWEEFHFLVDMKFDDFVRNK
jgi:hypothetical protein